MLVETPVQAAVEEMEAILAAAIDSSDSDRQLQLKARVLEAWSDSCPWQGEYEWLLSEPCKASASNPSASGDSSGVGCLLTCLHSPAEAPSLHGKLFCQSTTSS